MTAPMTQPGAMDVSAPLIRQGEEGGWSWQGGLYQLYPWKGYVLKSGERALFHGDSAR